MTGALVALTLALATPAGLVEDLYSHRLLFDADGRPLVPIGMMQGRASVTIECAAGLVVTVEGEAGEQRVEVGAGAPLVVERKGGSPAVVSQWHVVETLEGADRMKKREALARFKEAGFAARALDVGGVYGVKGTVVDIRATQILVKEDGTRDLQARLEKLGVRPVPVELLDALPTASISAGGLRGGAVRVEGKGGAHLVVRQVEHSTGYAEHGFADRTLRGAVAVVPDQKGTLAVVSVVDEDALVGGVLPSEMFASAPLEALKAQAVTARGELFSKINRRHFADPFLVCSEQHCQVYKGVSAEDPRTNKAAAETRGELAFVNGRLVESVYSACCGGHTEAADVVWDRPASSALVGRADAPDDALAPAVPPAVPAVEGSAMFAGRAPGVPRALTTEDDVKALLATPREQTWCGRSSFNQKGDAYRWTRRFTRAELDAAFADLGVGEVVRLSVAERGPGGRLRALVVEGKAGTSKVLRELPVRKRLKNLRSGMFVIEEDRATDGALMGVTLRGGGFGHGSGMCQQGAIGMAEGGKSYREILGHYYEGAEVKAVF